MPNFKPKNIKKIKKGKIKIKFDKKHEEKMLEFQNIKEIIIPNLNKELGTLKKDFNNTHNLEEKLLIKEKIKTINKKRKRKRKRKKNIY